MYNIHGITETYKHIYGYIFGQDTAAVTHEKHATFT